MTDGVSKPGGAHPNNQDLYKQEYKQSADLFGKALDQYNKSDNQFQKAEFKDVMDKAMTTLNQSAAGMIRKDLEDQNKKIAKDYDSFQKHPGDKEAANKLKSDLDQAKKSVD